MENKTQNLDESGNLHKPLVGGSLPFIKRSTGCPICGYKMVYIRGKYVDDKKRKICPTCAVEKLENMIWQQSPERDKCCVSNDR